jgi:DNA-binding response OmpR family regulator
MSKNILVAEDDLFLGSTIRAALEERGATVRLTRDGEATVAALDAQQPDLLLLDVIMPRKDGLHVLRHVRDKGYTFPVVILSNLSGDMDPNAWMTQGARDYIVKSDIDEDDLWPRIEQYL